MAMNTKQFENEDKIFECKFTRKKKFTQKQFAIKRNLINYLRLVNLRLYKRLQEDLEKKCFDKSLISFEWVVVYDS